MSEPIFVYDNPETDKAWYDWLKSKDDKQLGAYWEFIRNWSPAQDHPHGDPDVMQMKYELTAQLMDERKL